MPDLRGTTLGERIRRARLQLASTLGRPVSLREVAAAVGVSPVSVGRWEANKKEPTLATIRALAAFFQVDPCHLAFDLSERDIETMPKTLP